MLEANAKARAAWDWGIFAILLIVLGGILLAREVPHIHNRGAEESR
jgi:hypothetical protein